MGAHTDPRLVTDSGGMDRLYYCTHYDLHSTYGAHVVDDDTVTRTRIFGAQAVTIISTHGEFGMENLGDGFSTASVPDGDDLDCRLRITWDSGETVERADGYRFLPTIDAGDLHLIGEGRHEELWKALGAHLRSYDTELDTVEDTSLTVWAPNARGVAVVGDFYMWNGVQYPMYSMGGVGIWELFIPDAGEGDVYKPVITTPEGQRRDKIDPMAHTAKLPLATGPTVTSSDYTWSDQAWMEKCANIDWTEEPIPIYEAHLGSWKQGLSYEVMAEKLMCYVVDTGYTHMESMPVSEHPFTGPWGYQVPGCCAPISRYGIPDQFCGLVDAFHAAGTGVIMDRVPGHFPKDEFALARFDGTVCYEYPDWHRDEQRDWGTYALDFGRNEVRNFLRANALYWAEKFHIDGLRVGAVASMLHLDYSRSEGEWLPNQYGGRENLDAIQFLQEFNATVCKHNSGLLIVAEESTSWPGATAPAEHGGLGFFMKWSMGWTNDALEYFSKEPTYHPYHRHELTSAMVYAYLEELILLISRDEVVHGKGSSRECTPGGDWDKAVGPCISLTFMWAYPGKQLLLQGQDLDQNHKRNHDESVAWGNLEGWGGESHRGIQLLAKDINAIYKENPAFYIQDDRPEGFQWINADDPTNSVVSFVRYGTGGSIIACVYNLSGTTQEIYRIGVPRGGQWREILSIDASRYKGSGYGENGTVTAVEHGWNGQAHSIDLVLPINTAVWLKWQD